MFRPFTTIAVLLAALLAMPALGQDEEAAAEPASAETETGPETETETATESDTETVADSDESDVDDSDLDEQTYEEDEDDFVPSEEIPADEPIPFPSNI